MSLMVKYTKHGQMVGLSCTIGVNMTEVEMQNKVIKSLEETLQLAQNYIEVLKQNIETQARIIEILESQPRVNYIQGAM